MSMGGHRGGAGQSDGLPAPQRYLALLTIWMSMAISVLDGTMVSLALPEIATDFGVSAAQSVWVVNAYQIAVVATVLSASSIGESYGYRRVYLLGLAGLGAGSVLSAFSDSLAMLASGRVVQGLGAAWVMGVNGALIRHTYPSVFLARGIGINTAVVATSAAAGPTLAAVIMAHAEWRYLFLFNLPFLAGCVLLGIRTLPQGNPTGAAVDYVSAGLCVAGFGGIFLAALAIVHQEPWPLFVSEAAFGAISLAWLIRRSRRRTRPVLPVDLLSYRNLRLSYSASLCSFAALMIFLIALPFHLQSNLGFDLVTTGFLISLIPMSLAISAPIAGRLVENFSPAGLGVTGLSIVCIAMAGMTLLPHHPPLVAVGGIMTVCGLGYGLFQTPNNRVLLGDAPLERVGSAAGMQVVARLAGQSVGAIIIALIFERAGTGTVFPFLACGVFAAAGAAFSVARKAVDA